MLIYPHISPIAISIGPINIYWYGIMYIIGFTFAWYFSKVKSKKHYSPIVKEQVTDMIFYSFWGVILGGRIGYIIFYDLYNFIKTPWIIFKLWNGGMSFHGGLIGVILCMIIFCRKNKCNIYDIFDFISPMVPIGLGAGRLGNFINSELWGRITNSSIGMIFPNGGPVPRYPSQLLEFILEGIILYLILFILSYKKRTRLCISANFLMWYGIFRFISEFFRQPEIQIKWITMGQILCIPMILTGFFILIYVCFLKKIKIY